MSNYYIFSNSDDCPAGWTKVTTYAGRTIYPSGETFGTTGGSSIDTHTHTTSFATNAARGQSSNTRIINGLASNNFILDYKILQLVLCKNNNLDLLNIFKRGSMIISENTTCPSGWYPSKYNYRNLVVTNGSIDKVINTNTHTHEVTTGIDRGAGDSGTMESVIEEYTTTKTSGSTNPSIIMPYFRATLCKKK